MLSLLLAAALTWQTGIWKDVQKEAKPPVMFAIGAFAVPLDTDVELFVIECDRMRYVLKGGEGLHLKGVIINDPVEFRFDGDEKIVVRIGGKEKKLRIVSRERLP